MMGVERAKRKQSGGLFSARGRLPWTADASGRDVDAVQKRYAYKGAAPPLCRGVFYRCPKSIENGIRWMMGVERAKRKQSGVLRERPNAGRCLENGISWKHRIYFWNPLCYDSKKE